MPRLAFGPMGFPSGVLIVGFGGAALPSMSWVDRGAFQLAGPFAEQAFQAAVALEKNRVACGGAENVFALDTEHPAWEPVKCAPNTFPQVVFPSTGGV